MIAMGLDSLPLSKPLTSKMLDKIGLPSNLLPMCLDTLNHCFLFCHGCSLKYPSVSATLRPDKGPVIDAFMEKGDGRGNLLSTMNRTLGKALNVVEKGSQLYPSDFDMGFRRKDTVTETRGRGGTTVEVPRSVDGRSFMVGLPGFTIG